MRGRSPHWSRTLAVGIGALLAEPVLAAEEASRPVRFGATYVSDIFANLEGGLKRGVAQMGLADLIVEIDGASLGLEGAQAYADVQLVHGRSLSGDLVGDAQVVSNIDAPDGLRLFEAWLSVPVAGKGFVKAGLIDLNGDFDVQSVGALFANSSHGIGPDFSQSGQNGPSIFPTTSTALVAGWKEEAWSARFGLFDAVSGNPDRPRRTVVRFPGETGLLLVGEADFKLGAAAELQLGAWTYTSRFETLGGGATGEASLRRGNKGAYAQVEGRLAQVADRPLDAWLRVGTAEAQINPIGLYFGGGLAFGEEQSRWGVAIAHARLGDSALATAGASRLNRAETNIEITYSRALSDRLTVQPDIQYVINPGWDRSLENALVAGLRVSLTLF